MSKLRIALRNYADFENALGEEARQFESLHLGVQVELISLGIHDLHRDAIAEGGLRNGAFDLALLVTDWLAEALAAGALEDLHPWHARSPLPDWPQGWASSLTRPLILDGALTSIPWHDGPECLVYRRDLFAAPERQAAYRKLYGRDLAPPSTWNEFANLARFFTDPAHNLYGTVFAAFPDGHNTLYDFALQLWSRGGELLDPTGRPQLTTPQAAEALDFYRALVRDPSACHPASPQLDSTQSGDRFLAGEVAMMVNWFGFAARSSRPGAPLAGKVGLAPIPSAPGIAPISLSVFWALAMGAGSRQKSLAWDFLRFVATPERDLGILRHGAVPVRLSSWRDPELQSAIPVFQKLEKISLRARQLPAGPAMAAFAAIIDALLTRALTTSDPAPAILQSAQRNLDTQELRFP